MIETGGDPFATELDGDEFPMGINSPHDDPPTIFMRLHLARRFLNQN